MGSSIAIGKGGQLHSFSKSEWEKYQDDVQQDGVYILWNPGGPKRKPTVYVGISREQNRGVAGRLYQHDRGQKPKSFWKQTFVVTGDSKKLPKSRVEYVEYWLYQRAREVTKSRDFRLDNKKTPPNPGKSKRQENEEFLQNLLHQLPEEVAVVFNQAKPLKARKPGRAVGVNRPASTRRSDFRMDGGWKTEVLDCIQKLKKRDFTNQEFYSHFSKELSRRHRNVRDIESAIRVQFQTLEKDGVLESTGYGRWRYRRRR